MASSAPLPPNGQLRYSAAPVFERADLGAGVITQLYRGDPFSVVGREGKFYEVRLPNGALGFVYGNNLSGTDLAPAAAPPKRHAVARPRKPSAGGQTDARADTALDAQGPG
jgi:hypothetical protein